MQITLDPASEAEAYLTCVIDSPGYDQEEMYQRVKRFFDRNPNLPLQTRQRLTEEGVDIMCRIVVNGDKTFERIRRDSARAFDECCRGWDLGVYRDTPVSFDVPDSRLRSLLNLTANDLFPGLVQPPGLCHNTKYGDPWHYIFCYRHVHAASNLGLESNAIDFLRMLSTNQQPNGWIRSIGRDFQSDGHPTSFDASYIDALYHYYKWTGDLESVRQLWPTVLRAVQFIEASLNPDDDYLYRDLIHQWKSDADSRGPSSSYQTALVRKAYADLSELAGILDHPWQAEKYANRARHIMEAAQKELWSPEMAMLGSKGPLGILRLHPECLEVEIPIWTGLVDQWQAFVLTDWYLHNISFRDERDGLWVKESDWWPLLWSQAMVADGDAVMIAWALLQTGHYDEGCQLLETIAGSGFRSPSPGMSYVVNNHGVYSHSNLGGKDPATAIGALGRAAIEGVFGVEPHLDRKHFVLRPRFAWYWDKASFSRKGLAIHWQRQNERQTLDIETASDVSSTVRFSVRRPVREVRIDGAAANFAMYPAIGRGEVEVELPAGGAVVDLRCDPKLWKVSAPPRLEVGQIAEIRFSGVEVFDVDDRFQFFEVLGRDNSHITVRLKKAACGRATLFLNCRCGNLKWIHPVVFTTLPENAKAITPTTVLDQLPDSARVVTVDLSEAYTDDIQRCFEHYFYWDHGPQFYLESHKPEKVIRYWFQPTFKLTRALPRRIDVGGIPFLLGPMGPGEELERHNDLLMLANTPPRELPTTARFDVNRRLCSVYLLSLNMTVSQKSYVPAVDIIVEYEDGERKLTQLIAPLNFDTYEEDFGINTVAYPLDDVSMLSSRRQPDGWSHHFTMTNIICDPDKVTKSIEIRSIATETFFGLAGMTLITVGQ
ncbi:MAG: alpha-L-rhamnosidase-related protein [Planctomycetota bacterium]